MKNLTIPKLFKALVAKRFKTVSKPFQFGWVLSNGQVELQTNFTKEFQRVSKIMLKPSKNRNSNKTLRSYILNAQGM